MPGREETNVRLPECAFAALARVAGRWGTSRDTAVRRLLDRHVALQEQLESGGRLTHISTVLRYPRPPRRRREPRSDRPLRLRLPPGLASRARAVSLLLPGQAQRAYRDYQGRLLTDAVMTAIAVEEPFTDQFLNGLLPLLRQRSALGLWQLAVAATSTAPENLVHATAETARYAPQFAGRRRVLLVAEALDDEVSWHSPERFQVAATIAHDLLTGADADANERMLYEQGVTWGRRLLDLRDGGAARDTARRKTPAFQGLSRYDWTGRGGTAVWRAERRVEVQDFEDWLIEGSDAGPVEREVRPPGWRVRVPGRWHAHAVAAAAAEMPEPYAGWVAEGKLLVFPHQEQQAVWPLIPSRKWPKWQLVLGIEPLVSAAQVLRPVQVLGFIEAVLINWNDEDEDDTIRIALDVPVGKAYDLGLITEEERRRAMAGARADTLKAMNDIIADLPEDQQDLRYQLEQVNGNAARFGRIAKQSGIKFRVIRRGWRWPGRSVVDELLTGAPADFVECLATCAYRSSSLILERSMQAAWHEAFDRHSPRDRV